MVTTQLSSHLCLVSCLAVRVGADKHRSPVLLSLVRIFAQVDVSAVVAALTDHLGEDEGDGRIFPVCRAVKLTHVDQSEQISPQPPDLLG